MPARSISTCSTPIRPVMPWYVGADRPRRRASSASAVLPTTGGIRVWGMASAVAPTVTTASQPSSLDDAAGAADVERPRQVRLDAVEDDEVVGAAGAHDLEVVRRPRDPARLAVDELDHRALLGEVVERVGIDLADDDGVVSSQVGERGRGRAGDVEPAGQPDEQHRAGAAAPARRCRASGPRRPFGHGQRSWRRRAAQRRRGARRGGRCTPSAPRRPPGRWPGTCRCAAGCDRACGSCRCRRCRWPAAPRRPWSASTDASRSIVPTTAERFAGSATNGVAHSRASAHP